MIGGGPRRPIKFFPVTPPELVVDAQVTGNDSKVVTTDGQTFIKEIVNLLHSGSVPIFGDEEGIYFDRSVWPMLTVDTPQDLFEFTGDDLAWGDLVDFDFDGFIDEGRTIEDGVPYYLYHGVDPSSEVDFSYVWDAIRSELSSEHSNGEFLFDEGVRPDTAIGCFAFITGLVRRKRDWIYGMNAIGLNVMDFDAGDEIARFTEAWERPLMQQAGSLNIQILRSYLGLMPQYTREEEDGSTTIAFDGVAGRYQRIADDGWLSTTALSLAKDYYRGRIAGIDLDPFATNRTSSNTLVMSLRMLLDDSLALTGSVADAERTLASLRRTFSSVARQIRGLNSDFGLVSGDISLYAREFNELAGDLAWLPTSVSDGQDLSACVSRVDDIVSLLGDMLSAYESIKRNSNGVIDDLWAEFARSLDEDLFSEELAETVGDCFGDALADSVGYVSGIMAVNCSFSVINKIGDNRYQQEKEEERTQKIHDAKLDAKRKAELKKRNKKEFKMHKTKAEKSDKRIQQGKRADARRLGKQRARANRARSQRRRRI